MLVEFDVPAPSHAYQPQIKKPKPGKFDEFEDSSDEETVASDFDELDSYVSEHSGE